MRREELFPQEVISDVPRITMTGSQTVHIEQHKGLIAYQPEEVAFRTASGTLKITGGDMRFKLYTSGEAVLMGRIAGITLSGAEHGQGGTSK